MTETSERERDRERKLNHNKTPEKHILTDESLNEVKTQEHMHNEWDREGNATQSLYAKRKTMKKQKKNINNKSLNNKKPKSELNWK